MITLVNKTTLRDIFLNSGYLAKTYNRYVKKNIIEKIRTERNTSTCFILVVHVIGIIYFFVCLFFSVFIGSIFVLTFLLTEYETSIRLNSLCYSLFCNCTILMNHADKQYVCQHVASGESMKYIKAKTLKSG